MSNIRNLPCPCCSGKKYKKCCLNKESSDSSNILSEDLKQKLDSPCWFHGSEQDFNSWSFPPPPKPGEDILVPHTAVFFTSDLDFAKGAGQKVARVSLSSNSRILDATANYDATEKLRTELLRHEIASRTININHDYWHDGWKTGAVLRMAYNDPALELHLNNMTTDLSMKTGLPEKVASAVIQHNSARGLIELICVSAKRLGFDAIYGHEVDRHSYAGNVIAQPWLAVLSKEVVSEPEWLQ